ncbi:Gfo/Idh/MocA family protein [Leucobacter luti]|uniref:Putative dehydrogenase n=1 Tax=Leucobacter luti TaxID=340320 RepID=A0A4Q7U279_9MICO|nr:Gfo/Idh/MocA family oxidoreductase [Leucobacter luti]MBL3699397.1 gfo/Idh/MocA family oxidoreductase [Leucobacter luti]RZT66907.1 putative dehydrogenase [Leucobacter luti]
MSPATGPTPAAAGPGPGGARPERLPDPVVPDPRAVPAKRWAILGTGWIAARFVEALQASTSQPVVAVGSRSLGRAAEFAAEHGIARAHGSYEELVADGDVDVVYIATGHLDHLAHATLAILAGKPVLVEKPMTPHPADTRALVELARERGVFAMEAVWTLALPRYSIVRQVLASGMLGEVVAVSANLGERLVDHHRAMDPVQGGGAMNDIGSYTIMFANEVLPGLRVVSAHGQRHPEHGSIGQFAAVLADERGRLATVSASMLADTPTTAYIAGTAATLSLPAPFYQPGPVVVRFHDGSELRAEGAALAHTQLFWEALEVARCLDAGLTESPLRPLDQTLATVALMAEARERMGDPVTRASAP